jgi:hypothetical protein
MRAAVDEQHLDAVGVALDPDRAIAERRLEVALPGVARLEHVAVGVDGHDVGRARIGRMSVAYCTSARPNKRDVYRSRPTPSGRGRDAAAARALHGEERLIAEGEQALEVLCVVGVARDAEARGEAHRPPGLGEVRGLGHLGLDVRRLRQRGLAPALGQHDDELVAGIGDGPCGRLERVADRRRDFLDRAAAVQVAARVDHAL